MTRTLSRPRIRARSNRLLLALLILAVAYVALDFLPIPANRVELHPLHRDDYANLARSIETLESHPPRPVCTFAITLLATAGPRAYYVALNALTIVYPALVFVFLGRLFGRSLSPVAMGIAAVLLFSFANSVEWAKYTGLMTNLLSGVFGVLALLCIYDGLAVLGSKLDPRRRRRFLRDERFLQRGLCAPRPDPHHVSPGPVRPPHSARRLSAGRRRGVLARASPLQQPEPFFVHESRIETRRSCAL